MIRAVVFDFDGLLIDTEYAWFQAYLQIFQDEFGLELKLDEYACCIGTENSVLYQIFEKVTGKTIDQDAIEKRAEQLHHELMSSITLRDGVKEYLQEAKQMGLLIGLASSSSRKWIEHFLEQTGIRDYFQVIKTKDDVTRVKPAPDLYLEAVKALGVTPGEAISFEDSPNGCKAAKTAGLRCVIVPNVLTQNLIFDSYDARLTSMADQRLEDLLQSLHN